MKTRTRSVKKTSELKNNGYRKEVKLKRNNYGLRLLFNYIFAFLIVAVLGIVISTSVLFKIDTINTQGDVPYSYDELVDKSGVNIGENLFFINTKAGKNNIEKALPYIERAELIRKFPNEMIIKVKPANKALAFKVDEDFVILSSVGKVLEISNFIPYEIALVKGIKLKTFELGSKATYYDKAQEEGFLNLVQLLHSNDLNKIAGIDFSSPSNIIIDYEKRININFGLYENMDYKLRMAKEIINSKIGEKESGILDLSTVSKDNRSYFKPITTN